MRRRKPTQTTKAVRYYTRSIKRAIVLIGWAFVLFLVIMGVVYIVPKIWTAVLG